MEPGPARRPNIITRNTPGWFLRGMLLAYEDGNDFLRVWRGGSDRGTERERVYVRVGGVGACGDGGWGGACVCIFGFPLFWVGWGRECTCVCRNYTDFFFFFRLSQPRSEGGGGVGSGRWGGGGGGGGGGTFKSTKISRPVNLADEKRREKPKRTWPFYGGKP